MKQQVWVADTYIGTFECPESPELREVYMNEVVMAVERDNKPLFETFHDALLRNGFVEAPEDDDCLWWAGCEPTWLLQAKLEAEIRKNPKRSPFGTAVRWLNTYSQGGFSLSHLMHKDQQWGPLMGHMLKDEELGLADFQQLEQVTGFPASWWLDLSRRKPIEPAGLDSDPALASQPREFEEVSHA